MMRYIVIFLFVAMFVALVCCMLSCEIPQSRWDTQEAYNIVKATGESDCFYDGFDVICLIPGPKGEKGDRGKRGKPGKDGIDGKDAIPITGPKGDTGEVRRIYIFSSPDKPDKVTTFVPITDAPEEPEEDVNYYDPVTEPEITPEPTKVGCADATCHVKNVGGKHILVEQVFGQTFQTEISDEMYQGWLEFIASGIREF